MRIGNHEPRTINSEKGVALIIALGILAILAILGTSFAINMRLEQKAAANYRDSVKAKYIAVAGIEKAIDKLKERATQYGYEEATSFVDGGFLGSNTYTNEVQIISCAGQIYLNDTGNDFLDDMLEELPGLGITLAGAIITYRNSLPDGKFITKEQVKLVPGIDENTFNDFKDYVSVYTYIDTNAMNTNDVHEVSRAPVDVNTASTNVLNAVLLPLGGIGSVKAQNIIDEILRNRPIGTWAEFEAALTAAGLSTAEFDTVWNNCNPNRHNKPDFYGDPRTTEFCFHSGGYYEIQSIGQIFNPQGEKTAEKKITAIVNIFKVWNQTSKGQFAANSLKAVDVGGDEGTRFYYTNYPNAVQLAHLLVETEEDGATYSRFNFEYTDVSPPISGDVNPDYQWQSDSGGYTNNPYSNPDGSFCYRYDYLEVSYTNDVGVLVTTNFNNSSTCQWNYELDADLTGHYDIYAWCNDKTNKNTSVSYSCSSGDSWSMDQSSISNYWGKINSAPIDLTTSNHWVKVDKGTGTETNTITVADAMLLAAVNDTNTTISAGTMDDSFCPGVDFTLGTVAWTEDIYDTNTVITFNVSTNVPPNAICGAATDASGSPLIGRGSGTAYFYYRAYFSREAGAGTIPPPILDDITVTYLPRTKILYWREE